MRKWTFAIVAALALTVLAAWTPQASAQRVMVGIGYGGYGPAVSSYGYGYYPGYNYAPAYRYAPAYSYGYAPAYGYGYAPAYSYGYAPSYSYGYNYGYNYGYAPRGVGVAIGPRGGVGVGYYGPNVSFGYSNFGRGYGRRW